LTNPHWILEIIAWALGAGAVITIAVWGFVWTDVTRSMRAVPTLRLGQTLAAANPPTGSVCAVVPAHNEARVIAGFVRSLRAETYPELRVVLALDRCTDNTAQLVRDGIAGDGRFEIVEIDAAKPVVTRRASLAPCEGPSGLAIDVKNKKLFSVCGNKMMAVTDIATMKVIATPAIGSGVDGAGFDSDLAFSSNGEGTMTIVKAVNGKYEAVDTVTTERGARTMTVDPTTHRIYMLAAEYGPAPAAKEGQKAPRPPVLPDSFHVIVIGK